MILPYVAARTAEVTRSSVALVYKKVLPGSLNAQPWLGDRQDRTGPTMLKVPMQYRSIPVTNPLSALFSLPDFWLSLVFQRSICPERSSLVPIIPPIAILRINKTGNSLLAILGRAALTPKMIQHRPSPLKRACLYLSPIPLRNKVPKVLPTIMVAVFMMVPSIY